jgi:hypothetical protein
MAGIFKKKIYSVFIPTLLFQIIYLYPSKAQIAPGIEWRQVNHSPKGLNGQNQSIEQSGEEWWYSHKNVYDASGKHTSYVTVGYTSLVSTKATFTAAQQLYNEGPDSPYNPIDSISFNYDLLPEGCSDRDYLGEHRTPARGNIGLNSLEGEMIYCRPKTVGALEEVIQDPDDPDFFYVVGAHIGVKPYKNKVDFIAYNPHSGAAADYFSISQLGVSNYTNDISHLYVAKINLAGNVVWEGLYGALPYSASPLGAYEAKSYGYDLIKATNGKLVILGFGQNTSGAKEPGYPLLFELDPSNGYVLKQAMLPIDGKFIAPNTNTLSGYGSGGIGHSLIEIGASGKYAVGVTYYFGNTGPLEHNSAYVWCLDEDLNPAADWVENPVRFSGSGQPSYNSTIWEIKYHAALKQLLVPVISDCHNCAAAGQTRGLGYIYRLDTSGVLAGNGVNPSAMGPINAFDLRIGVEETTDGGFVAVSSTRPPGTDHSPPTKQDLGYLENCAELYFDDWDTDALVVKYNAAGQMQWSKTFDVEENRRRTAPPGDLKRQECLYKITQAADGGYVVSGNGSANFDDFYLAKLYYECQVQQPLLLGPNYVLDVTVDTTWSTSQTVLGKVVVHPGVALTITGPSTNIQFADSKLSGIETNITVRLGALLNVTNGARLSAIDTTFCRNSKWDGIKKEPHPKEENALLLYPNPAINHFRLLYAHHEDRHTEYSLFDVLGNEIRRGTLSNNLATQINVESLSEGLYFIVIRGEDNVFEKQKLIILK